MFYSALIDDNASQIATTSPRKFHNIYVIFHSLLRRSENSYKRVRSNLSQSTAADVLHQPNRQLARQRCLPLNQIFYKIYLNILNENNGKVGFIIVK